MSIRPRTTAAVSAGSYPQSSLLEAGQCGSFGLNRFGEYVVRIATPGEYARGDREARKGDVKSGDPETLRDQVPAATSSASDRTRQAFHQSVLCLTIPPIISWKTFIAEISLRATIGEASRQPCTGDCCRCCSSRDDCLRSALTLPRECCCTSL